MQCFESNYLKANEMHAKKKHNLVQNGDTAINQRAA